MPEPTQAQSEFLNRLGIELPIICGPMYPCSNPELVAAVSEAGGIGIVQPISLTYVHGYEFRDGLQYIKSLTDKPIGMNTLIEKSSRRYHERMVAWVDIALQEGVRFFITSMGKPDWVVKKVHDAGGLVYHDATERKWALKGLDCGVDGIIAVNNRAGGHAGTNTAAELYTALADLAVPLICAGGIGNRDDYRKVMAQGYVAVQMGTRFIASQECNVADNYKNAIVGADADDIVLTECMTGTPVSVIRTDYIEKLGLESGLLARWMLRRPKLKYLMRSLYFLRSMWQLKKAVLDKTGRVKYWQAGKSVAGIHEVKSVQEIMLELSS